MLHSRLISIETFSVLISFTSGSWGVRPSGQTVRLMSLCFQGAPEHATKLYTKLQQHQNVALASRLDELYRLDPVP